MNEFKSIQISPTYIVLNVENWYHDAIVQVYPKTITPTTVTWDSINVFHITRNS